MNFGAATACLCMRQWDHADIYLVHQNLWHFTHSLPQFFSKSLTERTHIGTFQLLYAKKINQPFLGIKGNPSVKCLIAVTDFRGGS